MKRDTSFCLLLSVVLMSVESTAQNSVQETRNVLSQWTQTHQIISRERSDWRTERSILTETKTLLSNELERLAETLTDLETSASAGGDERAQLVTQKDAMSAASGVIESNVAELETGIKAIITTLPSPLIDTIKPLIRRLPEDGANTKTSLAERTQNIVGILSQADKFNSTLTVTSESREMPDGKVVEVRTLYWGLAAAYYVDASGTFAGIGYPGTNGWEWPAVEGAGPAIQKLFDVYEGSTDIQFVEVPARIN